MYAPICVTFVPKLFHQPITINRFVFDFASKYKVNVNLNLQRIAIQYN